MIQNNQINLTEGSYSAEDAEEIVNSLIFSNVNYLEMKNFSAFERLGERDENALTKIQELKQIAEKTRGLIADAKANNRTLRISSDLHITIE